MRPNTPPTTSTTKTRARSPQTAPAAYQRQRLFKGRFEITLQTLTEGDSGESLAYYTVYSKAKRAVAAHMTQTFTQNGVFKACLKELDLPILKAKKALIEWVGFGLIYPFILPAYNDYQEKTDREDKHTLNEEKHLTNITFLKSTIHDIMKIELDEDIKGFKKNADDCIKNLTVDGMPRKFTVENEGKRLLLKEIMRKFFKKNPSKKVEYGKTLKELENLAEEIFKAHQVKEINIPTLKGPFKGYISIQDIMSKFKTVGAIGEAKVLEDLLYIILSNAIPSEKRQTQLIYIAEGLVKSNLSQIDSLKGNKEAVVTCCKQINIEISKLITQAKPRLEVVFGNRCYELTITPLNQEDIEKLSEGTLIYEKRQSGWFVNTCAIDLTVSEMAIKDPQSIKKLNKIAEDLKLSDSKKVAIKSNQTQLTDQLDSIYITCGGNTLHGRWNTNNHLYFSKSATEQFKQPLPMCFLFIDAKNKHSCSLDHYIYHGQSIPNNITATKVQNDLLKSISRALAKKDFNTAKDCLSQLNKHVSAKITLIKNKHTMLYIPESTTIKLEKLLDEMKNFGLEKAAKELKSACKKSPSSKNKGDIKVDDLLILYCITQGKSLLKDITEKNFLFEKSTLQTTSTHGGGQEDPTEDQPSSSSYSL